jgi:hypothetical protein
MTNRVTRVVRWRNRMSEGLREWVIRISFGAIAVAAVWIVFGEDLIQLLK